MRWRHYVPQKEKVVRGTKVVYQLYCFSMLMMPIWKEDSLKCVEFQTQIFSVTEITRMDFVMQFDTELSYVQACYDCKR